MKSDYTMEHKWYMMLWLGLLPIFLVSCQSNNHTSIKNATETRECILPCLFNLKIGQPWNRVLKELDITSIQIEDGRYVDNDGHLAFEHQAQSEFRAAITAIPEYNASLWEKQYFRSVLTLYPGSDKLGTLEAMQWFGALSVESPSDIESGVFQQGVFMWSPRYIFLKMGYPDEILVSSGPFPKTEGGSLEKIHYSLTLWYKNMGVMATYFGYTKWKTMYDFCFQNHGETTRFYDYTVYVYNSENDDFVPDGVGSDDYYTFDITKISSYTPAQLVKDFLEKGIDCFSIPRDTWKAEGG